MIKVFLGDITPLKNKTTFESFYNKANNTRREKIDRLNFIEDKCLSLASAILLDLALKENNIYDYNLVYNENGKPFLESGEAFFSISHSKDMAMCVISDSEVGCDIERVKEVDFRLANRRFHQKEITKLQEIADKSQKTDMFFRLWTIKESFVKLVGEGLKLPLGCFFVDFDKNKVINNDKEFCFFEITKVKGYKCSVCSKTSQKIEIFKIDFNNV